MAANPKGIEARVWDELDAHDVEHDRSTWGLNRDPDDWRSELLDDRPAPAAVEDRRSAAEHLCAFMKGFSDAEMEAAKLPNPHLFERGETGLFPIGEVTVIAAPGREGKTRVLFCLVLAYILSLRPVGLEPNGAGSAVIYSAEDSREQYARLAVAHCSLLGAEDRAKVTECILVPDLMAEGMEPFATLVGVVDREPRAGWAIEAVIGAIQLLKVGPNPPRLLVFETVSTLSDAEEDNRAFRALIKALRKIARETQTAVVLVHHTSQAAASNLPDLNIATSDVRGGTALVNNARQAMMLVNLGSLDDPFPENDARTVLRERAAPRVSSRVTALVCLDSSKGVPPPPIFFRWHATPYGPAVSLSPTPDELAGASWRKVLQMVRGERAERRKDAKDAARDSAIKQVVGIVRRLVNESQKPTARAVSKAAGRASTWATPYLDAAVAAGLLREGMERVPRVRDLVTVYRPAHPKGEGE